MQQNENILRQLERLSALNEKGVLTPEEFEKMKASILTSPETSDSESQIKFKGGAIRTKVVGVTYCNDNGSSRQAILQRMCDRSDKHAILRCDPHNPKSKHAIAVYSREYLQIGYLKDELARDIFGKLESLGPIWVSILNFSGGEGANLGCNIEIPDLDGPVDSVRDYAANSSASVLWNLILVAIVFIVFFYWAIR